MTALEYTTAGESHGPSLTAIVSGLPSGLDVDRAALDAQLARRQAGYGRSPRQQLEQDRVEVTAGIRHGTTTGAPVAMSIANRDHANWSAAMSIWPTGEVQGNWRDRDSTLPRPGHADLAGMARAGFTGLRDVLERASARETAARVAVGALASQFLAALGVHVRAHVRSIGTVMCDAEAGMEGWPGWDALDESAVRCLDADAGSRMVEEIERARADRDTLGGTIEVLAWGMPPGIGGYATSAERLDGRLAAAAMSVQAMKAVGFGSGNLLGAMRGSEAHDELWPASGPDDQGMGVTRHTNRAGGIEGGMANGAPIIMHVTMKPLPTLMRPLASVDLATGQPAQAHAERSDTCAVPAAAVVLESVIAFELARVVREQMGMQSLDDVLDAWHAYCRRVRYPTAARAARDA